MNRQGIGPALLLLALGGSFIVVDKLQSDAGGVSWWTIVLLPAVIVVAYAGDSLLRLHTRTRARSRSTALQVICVAGSVGFVVLMTGVAYLLFGPAGVILFLPPALVLHLKPALRTLRDGRARDSGAI